MKNKLRYTILLSSLLVGAACFSQNPIIHDAEYYIIEAQNGERWNNDDKAIDKKLKDFRKSNNGKSPNIIYVLIDDVGYGEIGMPNMSVTRGYKTPNIDRLAQSGMSLQRMYTEPSCTPTRIAMMTGRHPVRTGMTEAKATLVGEGLSAYEVTIAELLQKAGYNTSHVGKWHLGDIEESYANNQGFMHAEFPLHQQGQLAIMNTDAEMADVSRGISPNMALQTFTLDHNFAANPAHMVTGVELKDGKLYEVGIEAGESWGQDKYVEMNERYQRHAIEQLQLLSKQDKPFFLNYWPLLPSTYTNMDIKEYKTLNGGIWAESIVKVDEWVGEIMDEVETLGIAENTLIIVMGDNGPFMQFLGLSGASDRIYRGGKAQHLEGGVRANAYVSWPGMISPNSYAEDIIHVTDLFTTLARIGNVKDLVPRDRVIDGIDQSGIMLLGETYGRRDYVYIYEGPLLKSIVKNKYKFHLPSAGQNPIGAPIFDLYRDPREERPTDGIKYGVWGAGPFVSMLKRHMAYRQKYPDQKGASAVPYGGIVNLRPETIKMVELFKQNSLKK